MRKISTCEISIADFGLAKLSAWSTYLTHRATANVGTPVYMAPEVFRVDTSDDSDDDDDDVDLLYGHQVDCFCLGLVAFLLATGKEIAMVKRSKLIEGDHSIARCFF